MRTRTLLLLIPAALLAACSATAPTPRTLTVSGHGEVSLAPDVVSVTLGVQSRDPDVVRAVEENNRTAAAIVEAARAVGVASADMQTTYFYVSAQTQYDEFGQQLDEVLYLVDNNLTVRLRDVGRLSELLQAAVDAGASNIYGVEFLIAETAPATDQARQQALTDARVRAEQIAASAGLSLGEPVSISAGFSVPPPVFYAGEAFGIGGGGGPPISAGSNTVSADVTVVYPLR